MKKFLRGKSMWFYISGVKAKLIDTKVDDYAIALEVWEVDNSQIITWIIILSHTRLKLNWQNIILQRRYKIIYLDCIHRLIMPNSINLRQIFVH